MEKVKEALTTFKKKTIQLTELENITKSVVHSYEEFSNMILELENKGILVMVKAKGRNTRTPSLALQYRINKSFLNEDYHKELQHYRFLLHPAINLDEYYGKDPSIWKGDLPYIKKVDAYLRKHGNPQDEVPAPERSYELVGDEKWIIEKGGKELLERIGIFHELHIIPVSEPLMFAVNPSRINAQTQYHLIVENKTTYQGLLPVMNESHFSTLIYGRGKTIISNIDQFHLQYPVNGEHRFFYFGDIDREGISIWYSLEAKQSTKLAIPFYQACFHKEPSIGKEYQKKRVSAEQEFLNAFSMEEQIRIKDILEKGKYYPQETLKAKELQQIWRESDWTGLIDKK